MSNEFKLVNENLNPIAKTRDIDSDLLSYNLKVLMELHAKNLKQKINMDITRPTKVWLTSKVCTQKDIESDWAIYWQNQLQQQFVYHRKQWEQSYILQVLYENDMLSGKHGLGFACGTEPLPSYLISKGSFITAGDKPNDISDSNQEGWKNSCQYTNSLMDLYHQQYLDVDLYKKNFKLEYIDMTNISENLYNKFDFCWSVCAVEHLGSINKGLAFLKNSTKVLKKGGVSVHTLEYNMFSDDMTIDNWGSVLFQKKHMLYLEEEMSKLGCKMLTPNFDLGNDIFDKYIDMPPFSHQNLCGIDESFAKFNEPHLKLLIDGFPATCFGVILKKLN